MSTRLIRALISIGLLAIASDSVAQAPQEIRLWQGKAPGSEKWIVPEATTTSLKNRGYRTGLIGKWHLSGTVTGEGNGCAALQSAS